MMGGRIMMVHIGLMVFALTIASVPGRVDAGEPAQTPEQERLEKQKRVLEAMQTERRNKQQDKQKAEQERQDAAAKCKDAQKLLHTRQNARYLYRKGEDGEKVVFSEEERAQATAEAEAAVKKWCQ